MNFDTLRKVDGLGIKELVLGGRHWERQNKNIAIFWGTSCGAVVFHIFDMRLIILIILIELVEPATSLSHWDGWGKISYMTVTGCGDRSNQYIYSMPYFVNLPLESFDVNQMIWIHYKGGCQPDVKVSTNLPEGSTNLPDKTCWWCN